MAGEAAQTPTAHLNFAAVKADLSDGPLSSDARCNTPRRFGIGRIETSGSVAMRGYSHLSDDEREQIGLLKVLGHSIGAIARAIRRPKSTISRELSRNRLPSGATRRFTPPELINCAGGVKRCRERPSLAELRSRPPRRRMDARANRGLAESRKRMPSAGRGLRDDLRLHLPRRPKGRAAVALFSRDVTNAAARADRGLREIP